MNERQPKRPRRTTRNQPGRDTNESNGEPAERSPSGLDGHGTLTNTNPKKSRGSISAKATVKPAKPIKSFLSIATTRQSQLPATGNPILSAKREDRSHHECASKQGSSVGVQKPRLLSTQKSLGTACEDKDVLQEEKTLRDAYVFSETPLSRRPWAEQYGPRSIQELAIHKRKVQDVRDCLQDMLRNDSRKKVLVLSGPAGSGKSTTCRILASECGWVPSNWSFPLYGYRGSQTTKLDHGGPSVSLTRQGQYQELDTASQASQRLDSNEAFDYTPAESSMIILAEDFPVSLQRDSGSLQVFRDSIQQYLANSRSTEHPPLVIIITDTQLSSDESSDAMSAQRLLGSGILAHPGLTHIQFNPVAPTLMNKALKLVLEKHAEQSGHRSALPSTTITQLSSVGDIRSASSSLEFVCLEITRRISPSRSGKSGAESQGSRSGAKAVSKSSSYMEPRISAITNQREASLGLFHTVGKVVYNKRSQTLDQTLPQPPPFNPEAYRPTCSLVDVDSLIDETGTSAATFLAAIHENYVLSCNQDHADKSIRCIENCASILSDSDLLIPSHPERHPRMRIELLRQDEVCFHVAVRGLLFHLPSPVKRSIPPVAAGRPNNSQAAFKMFYPMSARLWKLTEETQDTLRMFRKRMAIASPIIALARANDPGARSGIELWNLDGGRTQIARAGGELQEPNCPSATDVTLYRLPFAYQVFSANRSPNLVVSSATAEDLECLRRAVTFQGIGGPIESEDIENEATDQTDAGFPLPPEQLAPLSPEPETRLGVQLYLSDDDIEEDYG